MIKISYRGYALCEVAKYIFREGVGALLTSPAGDVTLPHQGHSGVSENEGLEQIKQSENEINDYGQK